MSDGALVLDVAQEDDNREIRRSLFGQVGRRHALQHHRSRQLLNIGSKRWRSTAFSMSSIAARVSGNF
ncbi:MAG: hypothetical protein R2867_17440 [Caldilineaceae bacterium]